MGASEDSVRGNREMEAPEVRIARALERIADVLSGWPSMDGGRLDIHAKVES